MKTITEMTRELGGFAPTTKFLEQFAALVRADEREACAKVCDEMAFDWQKYVTTPSGTITACAAAIRARGETAPPKEIDPNQWAFDNGLEST